jgi:hypothetical protein
MKMNRLIYRKLVNAVAIFAMALTLVSCLDGGGNNISGSVVGIIRYDVVSNQNLLDIDESVSFSSPGVFNNNLQDGACLWVVYELDYDLPENQSSVVSQTGYWTVTVSNKVEINRYYAYPIADTSSIAKEGETPLMDPAYEMLGYVKGVLFINHVLEMSEDQRMDWQMTYNGVEPSVTENGEKYYDVYLRTVVTLSGTKSAQNTAYPCAYEMSGLLKRAAETEKAAGKSTFKLRFNYVSEIKNNEDGTRTVVWSKSSGYDMNVETISPTAGGSY